MNGTPPIHQPETVASEELTFVRIQAGGISCLFFPPDNRIGTRLLLLLLKSRMELAGIEVKRVGASGELNDAVLFFAVPTLHPALGTILHELQDCVLLDVAQVGYFDYRELVIRSVHPKLNEVMEIDSAAVLDEAKFLQDLIEISKRLPSGTQ